MRTRDHIVQDLLDRLHDAPADELAEVVDFAEFLLARRLRRSSPGAISESEVRLLEAQAAEAGLLRLPEPNASTHVAAITRPVQVGGVPASQIVLDDRR